MIKQDISVPSIYTRIKHTPCYAGWLVQIAQLLTKRFNRSAALYQLTFTQLQIIFIIRYHGKRAKSNQCITPRQLSNRLGVSLANTTGLVDRLVRDGILQRRPSSIDRRSHYLQLTVSGQRLVKNLIQHWPPADMLALDKVFKRLSKTEHVLLQRILIDITKALQD